MAVGEWWGPGSVGQIGVVAFGEDDDVLVGQVKWGRVGRHDLAALRRRTAALVKELDRPVRIHTALFSGRGMGDPDTAAAVERGEVLHLGLAHVLGRSNARPPA